MNTTALGGLTLVAQAKGEQAQTVRLLAEALQSARTLGYPRSLTRYAEIAVTVNAPWALPVALARRLSAVDASGRSRLVRGQYS
jgi:hypothetical protein